MNFHEEFLVDIPMFDASSLPLFPPAMASILSRRRRALLEAVVEAGNRRKRRCSPFTWRPSNAVNSWDIAPQKERARILVRFYCSISLILFWEFGLREHVRQKPWFSPWRNLKVVHMFPWSNSGNKNRGDVQTGNHGNGKSQWGVFHCQDPTKWPTNTWMQPMQLTKNYKNKWIQLTNKSWIQ